MRMRQLKDLQNTNSELLAMHARLQQEHAGTAAQLAVRHPVACNLTCAALFQSLSGLRRADCQN